MPGYAIGIVVLGLVVMVGVAAGIIIGVKRKRIVK